MDFIAAVLSSSQGWLHRPPVDQATQNMWMELPSMQKASPLTQLLPFARIIGKEKF